MTAYADFIGVTCTAGEQALVAAAGLTGEDANGVLNSVKSELKESKAKLKRISDNMGAGTPKDKIDAWIAILA